MFNPRRFWLYYNYKVGKYLDSLGTSVATLPSFGCYSLKPKHYKVIRKIGIQAFKKEWKGEITNYEYRRLLKHYDYID